MFTDPAAEAFLDNTYWEKRFDFVELPKDRWPPTKEGYRPDLVHISTCYTVQIFHEANDIVRLTISSRIPSPTRVGTGLDGISWDDLMAVKCAVGYAEKDAVELYPAIKDVVNVANMRHLWVMPEPLPYAWRKNDEEKS